MSPRHISVHRSLHQPVGHIVARNDLAGLVVSNMKDAINWQATESWESFAPTIQIKLPISADQLSCLDVLQDEIAVLGDVLDVEITAKMAFFFKTSQAQFLVLPGPPKIFPKATETTHFFPHLMSNGT
jgi:hypothetical protein